jgi:hypothetical protein
MSRILDNKWLLLPCASVLATCVLVRRNPSLIGRRIMESSVIMAMNPGLNLMVESGVPVLQIVGVASSIVIYPIINYGFICKNLVEDIVNKTQEKI